MENSIALIRRKKKVRQNDMARSLGVTPSYLCKVEKNIHEPSDEFIKACAAYLETDIETILNRTRKRVISESPCMLWDFRIKAGITQRDLAKSLKCSPSYLSKIEQGEIDPPTEFKKECAKILGQKQIKIFPENGDAP